MSAEISLIWRPLFAMPWLLLWLAAAGLLIFAQWHDSDAAVRRSYRLALQGMRILGLLLLFLWLCRPVVVRRLPEKGAYRLAVLADLSRSMEQVDPGSRLSRRQYLEEFLRRPSVKSLSEAGEVEFWGFSEELHPLTEGKSGSGLSVLPGATCLGEAMVQASEGRLGARPLGGMLLFSDGRWNDGISPVEVAKRLARLKIPVSCVGVGAPGTPEDVEIHFAKETPAEAGKNEIYSVEAVVKNHFSDVLNLQVRLYENGQPAAGQMLRLPPHSEQRVHFRHRSLLAGMRSLSVKVEVPSGDLKPENNIDYMPVEIREPDRFRILYLSNAMHWEWRFLKINAENQGQLQMSAIIRTGSKQFFQFGLKKEISEKLKGFPENTEVYSDFDAVLTDAEVLWQMPQTALAALAAFVEYKGGGLLITGMNPEKKQFLPEIMQKLCPVYQGELRKISVGRILEIADGLIFQAQGNSLLHTSRGLPLYGEIPAVECTGIKKAARVLMELRNGKPVMVGQGYGAGRCVYLGLRHTWQWRMREEQGLYEEFWNQLLCWLASNRTAPVEVLNQNCRIPVDVLHELSLRVAGTDFLPAPDAAVTAEITDPAGRVSEISLHPALEEIGRYSSVLRPSMPGEYAIRYRVKLPDGQIRSASASLLAVLAGREVRNAEYHEEILRDIARISGGRFYSRDDFPKKNLSLPLSENLPVVETEVPLLDSWWMLVLLCGVWIVHWWMRRRIGLK